MKAYSAALKKLRKNKMITQKDMAAILQIAPGMYALYENGNRRMRLEMLIRLADILETSTDYLLGRTDEAAPYPKTVKRS